MLAPRLFLLPSRPLRTRSRGNTSISNLQMPQSQAAALVGDSARCGAASARACAAPSGAAMAHSSDHHAAAATPSLRRPLLLVSDLDDTLIPGAHTSAAASEDDTAALRRVLAAARADGRFPVRVGAWSGLSFPATSTTSYLVPCVREACDHNATQPRPTPPHTQPSTPGAPYPSSRPPPAKGPTACPTRSTPLSAAWARASTLLPPAPHQQLPQVTAAAQPGSRTRSGRPTSVTSGRGRRWLRLWMER
jgi:hypothetical protein